MKTIGKPWEHGGFMGFYRIHPLVVKQVAIENGNLQWIYPLNMVILHSYVKLPEGIIIIIIIIIITRLCPLSYVCWFTNHRK